MKYQPNDSVAGPIIHQLALLIQAQIGDVGRIYETPPDGPPEDNSVQLPYEVETKDDTTGKLKLLFKFDIHHNFRRAKFSDSYAKAQAYLIPWAYALSGWGTQTLGGKSIGVHPGKITVRQLVANQQPFVALVSKVEVTTEINIPLV